MWLGGEAGTPWDGWLLVSQLHDIQSTSWAS